MRVAALKWNRTLPHFKTQIIPGRDDFNISAYISVANRKDYLLYAYVDLEIPETKYKELSKYYFLSACEYKGLKLSAQRNAVKIQKHTELHSFTTPQIQN